MDNPETHAALGKEDTGRRQKQNTKTQLKRWATGTPNFIEFFKTVLSTLFLSFCTPLLFHNNWFCYILTSLCHIFILKFQNYRPYNHNLPTDRGSKVAECWKKSQWEKVYLLWSVEWCRIIVKFKSLFTSPKISTKKKLCTFIRCITKSHLVDSLIFYHI